MDARGIVEAADAIFIREVNAGNIDNVVNLYTKDAVIYPGGPFAGSVYTGHAEIKNFWTKATETGVTGFSFDIQAVTQAGDLLIEESKYTHALGSGCFIVIWKQEDGQWKLFKDIFN
eukprot:GILK01006409.1.p1 GENE.GILK01006409.1~~GILK01006409.1.p1  ORF type:complete len:130 (-),score=22.64 GILK01006409.1:114-464(-)